MPPSRTHTLCVFCGEKYEIAYGRGAEMLLLGHQHHTVEAGHEPDLEKWRNLHELDGPLPMDATSLRKFNKEVAPLGGVICCFACNSLQAAGENEAVHAYGQLTLELNNTRSGQLDYEIFATSALCISSTRPMHPALADAFRRAPHCKACFSEAAWQRLVDEGWEDGVPEGEIWKAYYILGVSVCWTEASQRAYFRLNAEVYRSDAAADPEMELDDVVKSVAPRHRTLRAKPSVTLAALSLALPSKHSDTVCCGIRPSQICCISLSAATYTLSRAPSQKIKVRTNPLKIPFEACDMVQCDKCRKVRLARQ